VCPRKSKNLSFLSFQERIQLISNIIYCAIRYIFPLLGVYFINIGCRKFEDVGLDRSITGTVGSNPALLMDVYAILYVCSAGIFISRG
jgi:hypothetical protein